MFNQSSLTTDQHLSSKLENNNFMYMINEIRRPNHFSYV